MFKKLKQKINEEQSPQRNVQSPQQAQVSSGDRRGQPLGLLQDTSSLKSDREVGGGQLLAGMIAEPAFLSEYTVFALDHSKRPKAAQVPSTTIGKGVGSSPRGSMNGDGAISPLREEPQSIVQKLQQRVSSVESLFRVSGRAEGLFQSGSRESLVRSPSRDSLNPVGDTEVSPAYDPPSDIESETEDTLGNEDTLSKEQLLHRLHRVEKSLANYRGKYSELVTVYRTAQRDKEKTQAILSQSQDKALRRIGELREELQMDQQAKKHLQEEFDAALEEKDQMITVLQSQVELIKKRLQGAPGHLVSAEVDVRSCDASETSSDPQSHAQVDSPDISEAGGSSEQNSTVDVEALQKRILRQETLLQRCKELINTNKECSTQLSSENEALQQQLQERLQELEKMKDLHTTEKTKLITQLRDAKNLIEQLEQDKGMVIAETKRQMHETLEMKEEEIAQLRSRIQQTVAQKEELQEQREKAEKAAFEELERALGLAQRAEEARRQLQADMEEQMKKVERVGEEERRNLQQELTRVKHEVVTIMKKSTEDRIAEIERLHSEALANKDKEICAQINQALEQCRDEFLQATQEKEQQASLAFKEADLQKAALQADSKAKANGLLLELESARTRILELESCLTKNSQKYDTQVDQLSAEIEEQRKRYEAELAALEEKHLQELERSKTEQGMALNQQHTIAIEELVKKHKSEFVVLLKDKEAEFQTHVEYMNQKTLEKLDVKQAELEALILKLSDVQKNKEQLEYKLATIEAANDSMRQEFELKLMEDQLKHQTDVEDMKCQHDQSLAEMEKMLKEELNQLKLLLEKKNKDLEELVQKENIMEEDAKKSQQDAEAQLKEMEDLKHVAQCEKEDLVEANINLNSLKEELEKSKSQLKDCEMLLEISRNDCQQKAGYLQQKQAENEELHEKIQQAINDLSEKEKLHTETCKAMQEKQNCLMTQLNEEKSSCDKTIKNLKKEMDAKLKSQETKMEKIKNKAKEMQEKFKKRLHEQEENAKAELAKKDEEIRQKDQQVKEKILEMTQANSEGLSSAISDLEANHNEQLVKLQEVHRFEQEDLFSQWHEKLSQQEEEIKEKHALSLQEKVQCLHDVTQQLVTSKEEKEQVVLEVKNLREELAMRETTVQKLQAELREAAVKLESLSEKEHMLKKQVETVEKNLNQAMTEKNLFQDQLSKIEAAGKERLKALSEELEDTCKKLGLLESSKCKEVEDLQKALEEKATELQSKEKVFQEQICAISKELEKHCQGAQKILNCFSAELCSKVESNINSLQNRVMYNQMRVCNLKKAILTKNDKICVLEKELRQAVEESQNVKTSLDQMALGIIVNSENLKALTVEKESLQKDAANQSQVLSEKVICIEKLNEENKNISENLKANILHISNLEAIIVDLKIQFASSMTEKEEALSLLNQQHNEEKQSLKCQMEETVERLVKEKSLALEQVDTLRNKMSEMKSKAESKLIQNHNAVGALQEKIEEMERQIAEKDEHLQRLTASIDNQSISKSEMDQVLSEKEQKVSSLTLGLDNCTKRISELEVLLELQTKEREQLAAMLQQCNNMRESEKTELLQQLQQAQEQCIWMSDLGQKAEEKINFLETEIKSIRQQQESQKGDFEKEKAVIVKAKDDALKAAEESAVKVAELKKKAEQKIGLIRKQLTLQIEEKEQVIKDLQAQLEDIRQRQHEREQHMSLKENVKMTALEELNAKHLKEVQYDDQLQKENLQVLKETYEEELDALHKEAFTNDELSAVNKKTEDEALLSFSEQESRLTEISHLEAELFEKTALVKELQKTCLNLQAQVNDNIRHQTSNFLIMESELMEEKDLKLESCKSEKDLLVKEYEGKLQELSQRLAEKKDQLKAQENLQKGLVGTECLNDGSKCSENDLQSKLMEIENEKKKIKKDHAQLQKDLRSLRKDHEMELQCLKKEMTEANEKKLKLEMEDMEMKHNSALKQLMREFNTQMALKEKELEASVKETIEKAQSVEAQLMESHREETSQLQKIIIQKDDDINRTVQRYEQVLQSREEEMGTRVWEVQKELEQLQQRSLSGPQGLEELQVQLAQKTSLLSEARLKEQEYKDRIHTLQDKIRSAFQNSVVTHLGSTYKEPSHYSADPLSEPTEFEYLRKVMFEYMMGRETKTMAKVITSILKFQPDQAQKVLEREDSRVMPWLR